MTRNIDVTEISIFPNQKRQRLKEGYKEYNKKRTKESIRRACESVHPRRICFGDKRVIIWHNPRRGECSRCGKRVGDEYVNKRGKTIKVKLTNIHHWIYISIFPWFGTEELCNSCHSTITQSESWKSGKRKIKKIVKLSPLP